MAELTDLNTVKGYLNITDTSRDSLIGLMIDAAEASIRGDCGRPDGWSLSTWTEVLNGEESDRLVLKNTPIVSITSVTVGGVVVPSTSYAIDGRSGVLAFTVSSVGLYGPSYTRSLIPNAGPAPQPNFGTGFQQVSVVYSGGYTDIPPELTMAATMLAASMFSQSGSAQVLKSQTLGQHTYTFRDPAETRAQLDSLLSKYSRQMYL